MTSTVWPPFRGNHWVSRRRLLSYFFDFQSRPASERIVPSDKSADVSLIMQALIVVIHFRTVVVPSCQPYIRHELSTMQCCTKKRQAAAGGTLRSRMSRNLTAYRS